MVTERATREGHDEEVETAWALCSDLYCAAVDRCVSPGVQALHRELVFCLLGGFGITYELARSAAARVAELRPFDAAWEDDRLGERLIIELGRAQFEPRRVDGELRRYRFPTRKAKLLVQVRRWLVDQGNVIENLVRVVSERERRRVLCSCPGMGPKTASWLLRNLGLANGLAIVDIHVTRALVAAGRANQPRLPRDYEHLERAFLEWCQELCAPPAAFDLFLWEWGRGSFRVARC
jgi:N-glycosylase/DNA lyase